MATNTIHMASEILEDTNGGFPRRIKFPNGLMMIWGENRITTTASGGKPYAYHGSLTLTSSFFDDFVDTNMSGFATVASGQPENLNVGFSNLTKDSIVLSIGSNANNDEKSVRWVIFGYWK